MDARKNGPWVTALIRRGFDLVTATAIVLLIYFNITFSLLTYEVYATLFLLLILNISTNKKAILNLENRIMKYSGKISYGLYMYHMLVISGFYYFFKDSDWEGKYYLYYLGVPLASIMIASLSYEFLEKPILKYKDRFVVTNRESQPVSKYVVL